MSLRIGRDRERRNPTVQGPSGRQNSLDQQNGNVNRHTPQRPPVGYHHAVVRQNGPNVNQQMPARGPQPIPIENAVLVDDDRSNPRNVINANQRVPLPPQGIAPAGRLVDGGGINYQTDNANWQVPSSVPPAWDPSAPLVP